MNKEIVGQEVGIFHILYECSDKARDGHKKYHCRCIKCGWETDMTLSNIKSPKICKHIITNNSNMEYVDHTSKWLNRRLKTIYYGIKERCYNINNKNYRFYGGKGIRMAQEWLDDPIKFQEWALSNGYNDDLTIDRIDSNKDYCPENCRWITAIDNAKYKSTTKTITINGVARTGREWAKVCEIGINAINRMLRENPEELVIQFIKARLKDKTLTNKGNQNWLSVYCIE